MHVLPFPPVGHKGDHAAVAPGGQTQTGFLAHLAQQAFVRAFVLLQLAAHADPLALVFVVLLRVSVQHQHLVAA